MHGASLVVFGPGHFSRIILHIIIIALALRIVEESGQALAPAQARRLLADRPTVRQFDTDRSEQPVWFQFGVGTTRGDGDGNVPIMAEFPSRHAIDTAYWDAATLAPLGDADR